MAKYVFVCGGVYSGTGKGVSCASMALLMKYRGHEIQYIKFDPYLNTSSSLLAPREHGEMWVTDDGRETDLDLGHVERICDISTSKNNICTSGTLYLDLIGGQEKFLGASLQVVPHLSNKVIEKIEDLGKKAEITFVEIGGTIGDIESHVFFESIRQFKHKHGENCLVFIIAPILWVPTINEFKTKPLQNSVRTLQQYGIQPDAILCRTHTSEVPKEILKKVHTFTGIPRECIFDAPDVSTIYQVPIEFYNRHVDDLIADKFRLKRNSCRIHKYREIVEKYVNNEFETIEIGIFGKYDNCDEAYLSLKEALYHSAVANDVKVKIRWIKAEDLENVRSISKYFEGLDGIIIPGGFDARGVEGKIRAIKFVREKKIPFLGICLGLQCSVIEFARNVCGIENANSLEFSKECTPVVHFLPGQETETKKSGTMRLGAYDCELTKDSLALELYGKKLISERHRHRYEVNQEYIAQYENKGFMVSGRHPSTGLVEIMELNQQIHPFFIGTQAHPEFKSRLMDAAPLFRGLVSAAKKHKMEIQHDSNC